MNRATQFAASFGLRIPILQAPIGSMAGPELAAAVSAAGGMGALALTWTSPENTRRLLAQVRTKTDKPVQANFVLAFATQSLSAALESGVRVITFSWGMPTAEISLLRSYGARFGIQVSTTEGAKRALEIGADFLICQGVEAGGHVQATQSLWDVLPTIVALAQSTPVVAAGGIGNGKAIASALKMGAAGAMLGTRFVATHESLAHESYKRKLVEAGAKDTALTVCFDRGWPYAAHRVLRNTTLENWEAAGCPPSGKRPGEGDHLTTDSTGRGFFRYEDTPPHANMVGDVEGMCLYAGMSCDDVQDIPSAKQLTERLWIQCENTTE